MTAFVLVHSPLVGPRTWQLVADQIRRQGIQAIAPALPDSRQLELPYWERHVEAVAQAVQKLPGDQPLILVAHSGAGVLLPGIRQTLWRDVKGYIFADAVIPRDHASRLDLFASSEGADEFRQTARDGLLPTWTDEDLREHIIDDDLRRRFVAELSPLPLAVYEERIPVFDGWPDAPCAYLLFSPIYQQMAAQAQQRGWSYAEVSALHFHMLVDPEGVAQALIALSRQMGAL